MRIRTLAWIIAGLVVVLVALFWFVTQLPAPKPTLAIGAMSFSSLKPTAPCVSVRLGITNTSRTAIRFNKFGSSVHPVLRIESQRGWEDVRQYDGFSFGNVLLQPGSKTEFSMVFAPGAVRWQVAYRVRAVSSSERILSSLPAKWRGSVRPICERLFSGREGPEYEIASDVFEVPHVFRPSDDETSPLKDLGPFSVMPPLWQR